MVSLGSASATTPPDSTPPASIPPSDIVEPHPLDFWTASAQMLFETIEGILNEHGSELFEEGFQLDSSLSFGESIQGEIDAVVPLWSEVREDGYAGVVFAQPGFTFWRGIGDEGRIDTNLGVVYRTNLLNTPIGFDAIGGASVFYDSNFRRGHSRLSLGVDAQHKEFHGGLNYYQPVSDEVDGRAGYVEDAVRGLDARLEFQRDIMRVSGNLGLWRYDGMTAGKSDWKTSYGLNAGVEVSDGIFIEGGYEKHDSGQSIGGRLSLGVAFKYSLPDLEGRSYGENLMSSDFYKLVNREKRVLYQERIAVIRPTISLVRVPGSDGRASRIAEEGSTVEVEIELSEALEEEVTINLVRDERATATYGSSNDYTVSVGGTACTDVTEDNCRVSIAAGQTSAGNVAIDIHDDEGGEQDETIILSTTVASAGDTGLTPGHLLSLTIPADPPLPTVSLSSNNRNLQEGSTATITLTLSERLEADATFNLYGGGGGSVAYGASNDWHLSVGGTDCATASESNPCQVTINAGDTTAEVTVAANTDSTDEGNETFTVFVGVDSGSTNIVQTGSPSSLDFTIPHPGGTVGIPSNLAVLTLQEGGNRGLGLEVSDAGALAAILESDITLTRTLTITGDEESPPDAANDIMFDEIVIDGSLGNADAAVVGISVIDDTIAEEEEVVTLTLTDGNNVLPQGWSIDPNNNTITITIPGNDQPIPRVSLSSPGTSADIAEGGTATITLTLSGTVGSNTTYNLIAGGPATYGTSAGDDWNLSVDGTDCATASQSNPCSVTIMANRTSAEATVEVRTDTATESREAFTVSVEVGSGNVQKGSPSSLDFAIEATQHTVTFGASTGSTTEQSDVASTTIRITPEPTEDVEIPMVFEGDKDAYTFIIRPGGGVTEDLPRDENDVFTFPGNKGSSFTARLLAVDDDNAISETIKVSLGNLPDNFIKGEHDTWTVNITDNDLHTVTFALATAQADEATPSSASVNINFTPILTTPVTLPIVITGDEDAYTNVRVTRGNSPVTFQNGEITIPKNTLAVTLSITAAEDADDKDDTVVVSFGTLPDNLAAGTPNTWTVTITDDDKVTGTIGFAANSKTITHDEADGSNSSFNLNFDVSNDAAFVSALSGDVTLTQTITITGDENSDHSDDITVSSFVIEDAASSTRSVAANILADTIAEGAETVTITLTDGDSVLPDGWSIDPSNNTATITIPANDQPVTLMAGSSSIEEGDSTTITLTLSQALASPAVFNLTSGGNATYGTSTGDDWNLSVGGTDCDMASGTSCQVTIAANAVSAEVTVKAHIDSDEETTNEAFSVDVAVASGSEGLVTINSNDTPLSFTILPPPDPTISLRADNTSIEESGMRTLTLTLNRALTNDATFNLVSMGTMMNNLSTYSESGGWYLTNDEGACDLADSQSVPGPNLCQVTIPAGMLTATATVTVNSWAAYRSEDLKFTVSVESASGNTDTVGLGTPSMLEFTIPKDASLPIVSLSTTDPRSIEEGDMATITLTLSQALATDAKFTFIGVVAEGGNATAEYGTDKDWNLSVGGNDCNAARLTDDCQVTITAGETTATAIVKVNTDPTAEIEERFTVFAEADPSNTQRLRLPMGTVDRLSLDFTIPADSSLPTVTLDSDRTSIAEEDMAIITLTLSEGLAADATFNLIGSGNAKYGTTAINHDWNLSVNGTGCDTASKSNPCAVMIPAGQTTAEAIVKVVTNTIGRNESKSFAVSVEADSGNTNLVRLGDTSSLNFTIPANEKMSLRFREAGITVDESNPDSIFIYGFPTDANGIEEQRYPTGGFPVTFMQTSGSMNDEDFTINQGNVVMSAGSPIATLKINDDRTKEDEETFVFTLGGGANFPTGWSIDESANTYTFTIRASDNLPTVSLNFSGSETIDPNRRDQRDQRMTIDLSAALENPVTLEINGTGLDYGLMPPFNGNGSDDWFMQYNTYTADQTPPSGLPEGDKRNCAPLPCRITIPEGSTTAIISLTVYSAADSKGTFTVSLNLPTESESLVELNQPTIYRFTIQ